MFNRHHRRGIAVTIYRFLQNSAFTPEQFEVLADCYEAALNELGLVSRDDPLALVVAEGVMRFAKGGELDPDRFRIMGFEWWNTLV